MEVSRTSVHEKSRSHRRPGTTLTYNFAYNGQGDRLQQTINGNTTIYVLDPSAGSGQALNAGLTQVLSDGTNTYLYGLNRIGEQQPGGFVYHLPDALGSVRQLTNASGAVTLAKSYEPFGSVLSSSGSAVSRYGFTGEQQESGLVYLRARFYASGAGRFTSRDVWPGDVNQPLSYNGWLYGLNNPYSHPLYDSG